MFSAKLRREALNYLMIRVGESNTRQMQSSLFRILMKTDTFPWTHEKKNMDKTLPKKSPKVQNFEHELKIKILFLTKFQRSSPNARYYGQLFIKWLFFCKKIYSNPGKAGKWSIPNTSGLPLFADIRLQKFVAVLSAIFSEKQHFIVLLPYW